MTSELWGGGDGEGKANKKHQGGSGKTKTQKASTVNERSSLDTFKLKLVPMPALLHDFRVFIKSRLLTCL